MYCSRKYDHPHIFCCASLWTLSALLPWCSEPEETETGLAMAPITLPTHHTAPIIFLKGCWINDLRGIREAWKNIKFSRKGSSVQRWKICFLYKLHLSHPHLGLCSCPTSNLCTLACVCVFICSISVEKDRNRKHSYVLHYKTEFCHRKLIRLSSLLETDTKEKVRNKKNVRYFRDCNLYLTSRNGHKVKSSWMDAWRRMVSSFHTCVCGRSEGDREWRGRYQQWSAEAMKRAT